jgi:hypothetical protein
LAVTCARPALASRCRTPGSSNSCCEGVGKTTGSSGGRVGLLRRLSQAQVQLTRRSPRPVPRPSWLPTSRSGALKGTETPIHAPRRSTRAADRRADLAGAHVNRRPPRCRLARATGG